VKVFTESGERVAQYNHPATSRERTAATVDVVLAELRARLEQRQFAHGQFLLCQTTAEMAFQRGRSTSLPRCPVHGDEPTCLREYVQVNDIRVELLGGDQDAT
jgi:hypothetical protein